eukprot:scaffold477_cov355-Pinguiococcus_pyrenoidosus.AAC.12
MPAGRSPACQPLRDGGRIAHRWPPLRRTAIRPKLAASTGKLHGTSVLNLLGRVAPGAARGVASGSATWKTPSGLWIPLPPQKVLTYERRCSAQTSTAGPDRAAAPLVTLHMRLLWRFSHRVARRVAPVSRTVEAEPLRVTFSDLPMTLAHLLLLAVGVGGVAGRPRVAILGQSGGLGRLSAELWRQDGSAEVSILLQEPPQGASAPLPDGDNVFSGDFRCEGDGKAGGEKAGAAETDGQGPRQGLDSFRNSRGERANLQGCESVLVAMDGGEGGDLETERQLFSAALKDLPSLPGRLCAVAPAKEPPLPGTKPSSLPPRKRAEEGEGSDPAFMLWVYQGSIFRRGETFDEAVKKAQQRGLAPKLSVLHHATLVGPSDATKAEADLPFEGPPLVAPKVLRHGSLLRPLDGDGMTGRMWWQINPASALGAVVLSGSRSPNPNPFVQLEAQEIYTTRSALARAALYTVRGEKDFLANALDGSGEYAEVSRSPTPFSLLTPQLVEYVAVAVAVADTLTR